MSGILILDSTIRAITTYFDKSAGKMGTFPLIYMTHKIF